MYAKRAFKLIIIAVIVILLVVANSAVGDAIESAQNSIKEIPIYIFVPALLAIQFVRKTVPIFYFIFPVGTFALFYMAFTLGVYMGVLYYCLLKLDDILYFFLIRRYYSNITHKIIDSDKDYRLISKDFRAGIRFIDKKWGSIVRTAPPYRQFYVVFAWVTSFYMEEYINLFWMATRSSISFPIWLLGNVIGLVAEYPKSLLKAQALVGLVNASSGSSSWISILRNLNESPWYTIVGVVVISCSSTIFVHGVHLQLLMSYAKETYNKYFSKKQIPTSPHTHDTRAL
eukprot:c15882_g1_i1.p1 GENE.c15882_g1_i1~~c15882_g1_i1.p1  ORF type:complete len:329 (+),score=119.63 c15882_g1_i1:130-987(+)